MKGRRFSAEFKRKVVLEAMRGGGAVRVIAARKPAPIVSRRRQKPVTVECSLRYQSWR